MKRRRKLQSVAINPLVVDLSHHNDVADFGKVKASGIAGIIHKATEAIGFVDNMYAVRRGHAVNAGLLWGAYHFLRPVSIPAQVDFFLKIAAPDNTTLLALNHKDERVPLIDAKEFLLRVEQPVGRKAVVGPS
jgi:lysozyme